MGIKREELLELITPEKTPCLYYWTSILTFFENNTSYLDINDTKLICEEIERLRKYFNTPRSIDITTYRNGHKISLQKICPSMNIKKEDVYPNVYDHLNMLVKENEEHEYEENMRYKTSGSNTNTFSIPLAAAPKQH